MRGIVDKHTPDGIRIWQIHYTADPDKDPETKEGGEWLANELMGYPGGMASPKWKQEMEVDFDSVSGQLLFPRMEEWKDKLMIPRFDVPDSWTLYGGFDYASRGVSAFVVFAKGKNTDDYYAIWEFYEKNSGYLNTINAIKSCPYYDRLEWIVADPQIWASNQQKQGSDEMVSIAQLFGEQGVHFLKGSKGGDIAVGERVNQELWNFQENEVPKFRLFDNCDKLWWEMTRLRFSDWRNSTALSRNAKESLIEKDNHAWDCFKYFLRMIETNWMSSNIDSFNPSQHIIG